MELVRAISLSVFPTVTTYGSVISILRMVFEAIEVVTDLLSGAADRRHGQRGDIRSGIDRDFHRVADDRVTRRDNVAVVAVGPCVVEDKHIVGIERLQDIINKEVVTFSDGSAAAVIRVVYGSSVGIPVEGAAADGARGLERFKVSGAVHSSSSLLSSNINDLLFSWYSKTPISRLLSSS